MANFKNFLKQNLKLVLLVTCGILVMSGILVLIFGGGDSEGWLKALFIVFGSVVILLGCVFLALALALGNNEAANFFLYDIDKRVNISSEELTFEIVDRKMDLVLSELAKNRSEIWTSNIFEKEHEMFNSGDAFVPLIAYKILYDMSDKSRVNESIWNLYLMADPSIISALTSAIRLNEDEDLAKTFEFLYKNSAGDYGRTAQFLEDNRKYIRGKMMKYVKMNLSKF